MSVSVTVTMAGGGDHSGPITRISPFVLSPITATTPDSVKNATSTTACIFRNDSKPCQAARPIQNAETVRMTNNMKFI